MMITAPQFVQVLLECLDLLSQLFIAVLLLFLALIVLGTVGLQLKLKLWNAQQHARTQ